MNGRRSRLRSPELVVLVPLIGLLVLLVPSSGASASPLGTARGLATGCQLVASPPTDYFGIIIPLGEVRCASTQSRIHIEVTLQRDGTAVALAARDCRKASTCILSVDASHQDAPGNQLWCTRATARIRSQSLGEAAACENQDF
jgi:hypothetical protein